MEVIRQFKALSDPTRLRLLHILNEVELNVNEIVSIVDMIQSGVSRHLKILLESG
ncbi:MAG: winged helix-turn-helix transcriptional regulator, partial [Desulfotignum balticum]|nr:winged helix-turn-helix transcriptional regulator [Desulfotignum balticum]